MKAAFYTRQGAARDVLILGDQALPEPGHGEVRVRLRASGVNPSDVKSRNGGPGRVQSAPLVIPHSDGAGDIDALGAGVADRIGERVWTWNAQWKRAFGTAAQYVVLPSEQAVSLPEAVSYAEGACLGIPALTALQAVHLAQLGKGHTVLVAGGAGAVAHYAIQIAKRAGARVFTTVSGADKAAHARQAGADEILNYRTEDVGARVRALTGGRGVDAVIEMDLTTNARLYPGLLKPHGNVVVYGLTAAEATLPASWLMFNSVTLRFFLVYELTPADRTARLTELDALLRADALHHAVALHLPLDAIVQAHEAVERGTVLGNVVLDVN